MESYAAQKNSPSAGGSDYILSLDADEEVSNELAGDIQQVVKFPPQGDKFRQSLPDGTSAPIFVNGFLMSERTTFLGAGSSTEAFGRPQVEAVPTSTGKFKETAVHETLEVQEYKSAESS